MNTNLKKLAGHKKGANLVLKILLGIVIAVCLLVLVGYFAGSGNSSAKEYTAENEEGDRVWVDVKYMSDYFASFTSKESDKMYFALDEEMYVYIVCIPDKEMDPYAAIQSWTFGDTDVEPDAIRTYGKLVPLDDEIMELAIEEFNWFWGDEVVDESNFYDIFGDYYIDTAVSEVSGLPYVFVIILAAAVVFLVLLSRKHGGVSAVTKSTMERLESTGEAAHVDEELQDIRARHFEKLGVYLTASYLVSYKNGLIVIPLHEVTGLYGVSTEKNFGLVLRDTSNAETEAVKTAGRDAKVLEELRSLVKAISEQTSGLEYGASRQLVEGSVDVQQIQSFFVVGSSDSSIQVQDVVTNADGTIVTPNYGLGILGAFIGALIGGILWFIIGKLGYIAGIVGFIIIYLSALGFKKGAKILTRGGAVISVVISLLMILASNYVLYAWMVTDAFEGRYTLAEVLTTLPQFLKSYDLTGDFVKDIVIGLALSLIAGFSTLRVMFSKNK